MKPQRFGPQEVPDEFLRRKLNALAENLIPIVSGRIAFPSTQNPSSDPNTLDDYEEGDWTPSLTDGSIADATFSTREGKYRKIGDLVFIWGRMTLSSSGTLSGSVDIAGLPFTADTTTGGIQGTVHFGGLFSGNITAGETVTGRILNAFTGIDLLLWDSTIGTTALTITEISSDGTLNFSGYYKAA